MSATSEGTGPFSACYAVGVSAAPTRIAPPPPLGEEHPDWRAAGEFGVDLAMLEVRLNMTPHQRLQALVAMERLHRQIFGRAAAKADP